MFQYKASIKATENNELLYSSNKNKLKDFEQESLSELSGFSRHDPVEAQKEVYIEFEMKKYFKQDHLGENAEYTVLVIRDIANIIKN